ncbi:dienelactone hydrolase family protein [Dactylonectria macrodidyma]|uniref:Dienelactone hydrolase family protein n=1 Tax=Dactylonectria macrodidyma TaxID=307937 RepID=A0A9P9DGA8_9HYPO|nr:dienelactone hydrolase family protein [Dactylonectria macrodidyma]
MASKACCELAPISAEYEPKGRWETIAGVNTYIVGDENAGRAIIDVYDVFGVWPQTVQGADRLAALIPALQVKGFVAKYADAATNLKKLFKIREEVGRRWPAAENHIGVFGLCWGGKIAILACGKDNEGQGRRFNLSGTAHPGRLDVKDGEATNVPHIMLASPGEPEDIVAQYKEVLSRPGKIGEVETYSTMFHGWMGARANLEDSVNLKEYERGYKQVAAFFSKYL